MTGILRWSGMLMDSSLNPVVEAFLVTMFGWSARKTRITVAIIQHDDGDNVIVYGEVRGVVRIDPKAVGLFTVETAVGQFIEIDMRAFEVTWQPDLTEEGVVIDHPFRLRRGHLAFHINEEAAVGHT